MKNNSNTSRGLSEMGTVGPTSDVKSLIVTGWSCSDQDVGG